jgi:AraC-like DNA-binding protein
MFYAIVIRENYQKEAKAFIPYQYEFMTNVSLFIDQNLDRQIATEEIALYFGYSTEHFCRLFKKCFNRPFKEYLNICRIEKAKEMMDDENIGTLTEIGKAVGFSNANHFSNIFKKCIGISPSSYLKQKKSNHGVNHNEISTV